MAQARPRTAQAEVECGEARHHTQAEHHVPPPSCIAIEPFELSTFALLHDSHKRRISCPPPRSQRRPREDAPVRIPETRSGRQKSGERESGRRTDGRDDGEGLTTDGCMGRVHIHTRIHTHPPTSASTSSNKQANEQTANEPWQAHLPNSGMPLPPPSPLPPPR